MNGEGAATRHGQAGTARPAAASRRPRRSRRRARRRTLAWGAVAVGVVLLLLFAVAAFDLRAGAAALREARASVEAARTALVAGDLEAAAARFEVAAASAGEAGAALRRPAVRLLAFAPVAGRNVATIRAVADSAGELAEAGAGVTAAVGGLPGGAAALAPRDGALPLEPLAALAPSLGAASRAAEEAHARLDRQPRTLLAGPVAQARAELAQRVDGLRRPAAAGAALAEALPGFLGADGPRRYLFGAQNPAELRGTGGLIGAWAELEVRDGRLGFGEFTTIGELTLGGAERGIIPAPSDDFERRWGRFAATTHGSNVNMSPHFPDVAEALLALHAYHGHAPVDGVIVTDPVVFQALLELTGPVEIPDVGPLDAEGVVPFLAVEQYAEFPEDSPRKPLLGEVAEEALGRFLAGAGGDDPVRLYTALAEPVGAGRLLLHSTHPEEQAAFESAGVAGALPADPPAVGVVLNNAAANKLDFFLEQEQHVELRLEADGSAWATTTLRLHNTAPTDGYAQTVLGPNFEGVEAGEHHLHVSFYCAGCTPHRALGDGAPLPVSPEREHGYAVASTWERLPSGAARELAIDWRLADAWDPEAGRLRLTVLAQPAYRPADAQVTVHAPADRLVAFPGSTGVQESVTWQGRLDTRLDLTVDVVRPWTPAGVARRLWDLLDRPLVAR